MIQDNTTNRLLKAQLLAAFKRNERRADACNLKTKMVTEALIEVEEKGDDSKLFRLTKRMSRAQENE